MTKADGGRKVAAADEVPGLSDLAPDVPVYMVNLLKFRQPDGVQRYLEYGTEVVPLLESAGATVCFTGARPASGVSDADAAWWDVILVVKYPTPGAYMEMVTDERYARIAKLRDDALERGDLIATDAWDFR